MSLFFSKKKIVNAEKTILYIGGNVMSVLVAIKEKDRVVVGVDIRMSCGEAYADSYSRRPKAVHLNDKRDIIIGAVGNCGLVDVMRQIITEYRIADIYKIDRSYIVKYILPALIVNVRDYELTDKEGKMDGRILIAVKDKAFVISGNYIVDEIQNYVAMGSGEDAARGSLLTSEPFLKSPEERIKIAIRASGSVVSTVSKASYIGDTAGMVFKPA